MMYEKRTVHGESVDALRIPLEVTQEMLAAHAQDGYTQVLECYLVLYKPPEAEVLREQVAELAQERDEYASRLTSPPGQGQPWRADARYIQGDEATDGGKVYISQRFNRGKRPSLHPECWAEKPAEVTVIRWEDDPARHAYTTGDLRTYDLDGDPAQRHKWRCKKNHTKSAIRKPQAISDYWEAVSR